MSKITKLKCFEIAETCKNYTEFRDNYHQYHKFIKQNGLRDELNSKMPWKIRNKWTKSKVLELASTFDSIFDFQKKQNSAYNHSRLNKYFDEVQRLFPERQVRWTEKEAGEKALKYKTIKEFAMKDIKAYRWLCSQGLIDDYTTHMVRLQTGWSFSEWSKGFDSATFYILKCYDDEDGECFYKFGITRNSIAQRYLTNLMPYEYEIITEVYSDARIVWDLEQAYKKYTLKYRYLPDISFPGSIKECFKCRSDHSLVK